MLASEVIKRYEAFCPKELSLEGDSVGLQIGTLRKDIKKIMIALDVREQTVQEAIEKEVDLIIVKHAPIFRPIKNLCVDTPQNQMYSELIKHDIAVYVSHTNIDVLKGGLNDWFCDLLEIEVEGVLHETAPNEGIGRIGCVQPQTFEAFATKVKQIFGLDSLRMIAYENQAESIIERVAICGGSGDSFFRDAVVKQADVYITGDIYYHTAQDMLSEGLLALDPGHYIEVLFIEKLTAFFEEWKQEEEWDVEIVASQASTNPFSYL
ncbi:Nif3-like dinuclear metal center hexameric protein [Streptococcus himalayensis]|uniref:GTP cyclohydrolase 1 type 2 homolog n=1 Tax=Streptococcus himalayensis TaxID=1888195 RepID=A0A917EF25_9STRE|nr:Nif3-like dinuclear metal center hexameric protein [Streptococcus himalayensis]GGE31477.1 GTP cyclohydrolase 1 type 2 [Streptococcus himalayensis]